MRVGIGGQFNFDVPQPPAVIEFYIATPLGERLTLSHTVTPFTPGEPEPHLMVTEANAAALGVDWQAWENAMSPGSPFDRTNTTVNGMPRQTPCDPFTGICEPANDIPFNKTWLNFSLETIVILVDAYDEPSRPFARFRAGGGIGGWTFLVPEPSGWMSLLCSALWPWVREPRR
jgi:hypothetical protein